jgi:putative transposase
MHCESVIYAMAGAYYVTIVTKDRIQYFGSVKNGEIVLNEMGLLLRNEWLKTPQIRPDMHIVLDKFIIMPDHLHAILIIGKNQFNSSSNSKPGYFGKPQNKIVYRNRVGPQSKNLSSIIRGFKSAITTYAKKNHLEFGWQNRFYDHIIRSNIELYKIRNYIINNPSKWIENFNSKKHF